MKLSSLFVVGRKPATSVAQVLSSFTQTINDLERIEQEQQLIAANEEMLIREAENRWNSALCESAQANKVANQIRSLIS